MIRSALAAYLKFAFEHPKLAGDKEHIINTMAHPRPGFFETLTTGEGSTSNFTTVERPYNSTSAYPWDNDSDYMQ